MKLLFVIAGLGAGGAEKSLVNLLEAIKNDYEIDLLLFTRRGINLKKVPASVRILNTPYEISALVQTPKSCIKEPDKWSYMLKRSAWKLKNSIVARRKSKYENDQLMWRDLWSECIPELEGEYDIACGFMHGMPSYYVMDKVKAKRKYLWIHHFYSELKPDLKTDGEYFRRADAVIAVSNECEQDMRSLYPEIKDRFITMPNIQPVDQIRKQADEFYPEEYSADKRIICSVGRLHQVKGFDMSVRAAAILKKQGIRFNWFIIGDGNEKESLNEQIKKNDIEDCFILLGLRDNPIPYMKNADIVVQSSYNEGKSMIIDEAKIAGCPVVCTNYRSASDQIRNGETGVLTKDISAEAIADAILRIFSDDSLYNNIKANLKAEGDTYRGDIKKYYELFGDGNG